MEGAVKLEGDRHYGRTEDGYGDYEVVAVCSTPGKAEKLCKLINRKINRKINSKDKIYSCQAAVKEYPVDSIYNISNPIENLDIPRYHAEKEGLQ